MNTSLPVILITGAGHGLGNAIAKALSQHAVQLVLTSKSRAALEDLDDQLEGAVLAPMDFRRPDEIDKLAGGLLQRFGRLDALISCHIEMLDLTPVAHLDPKNFQSMLTINLVANHRLIRAMDPLLQMSEKPLAMFMTCEAGRSGNPAFWSALATCKAGLEAMVESYKAESVKSGVQVLCHDPGPLPTRSRRRAYPGEPESKLPSLEAAASDVIDQILENRRDWRHA